MDLLGGAKKQHGQEYICTCPAHNDHKPSLWVSEGQKGIIMKCRANKCSTEDICRAIGIEMSQLFRDPLPKGGSGQKKAEGKPAPAQAPAPARSEEKVKTFDSYEAAYGWIGQLVKVYPYTNGNGQLLFEVARIRLSDGDKTFRQHRPADPSKGKFPIILNVPAEIRAGVLYRQVEVNQAVKDGRTVYVVEGEKDADTMAEMGYTATTCPGGAKSWTQAHSENLRGADVVILPDNDEPGEGHAQQVAELTITLAKRIRVVKLKDYYPKLPHKGDISDLKDIVGREKAKEILDKAVEKAQPLQIDLYRLAMAAYNQISGYCIYNGCTCQNTENGPKILGTFVALPISEVTLDDGVQVTKKLEIAGWSSKGKPMERLYIDMDKFSGMSWAANSWGLAANIMPGTTVKDKLRAVITAAGAQVATQHTIYAHTGWRQIEGKWAYLYDGGAIGAEGVEVSMDKGLSMYGFGKLPKGLDLFEAAYESLGLTDLVKKSLSVPLLGLMYLAPLREFQERAGISPSFITMLKGGTSVHKSTLATLFLSHFGDFKSDTVPANFHDTTNAIRRKAFILKDMPLLIDDYHPASSMQERRKMEAIAQNLSRAFGDNADRGRLTSDLTLQAAMPPRGVALMTGEELPDIGESGINRFYLMEVEKDDVALNDDLTNYQRMAKAGDLRQAMRGYIEWMLPRADGMSAILEELFYSYRDKARRILTGSGAHDRAAPAVAHIMIGLTMMLEYFEDLGVIDHEGEETRLEEYWRIVTDNALKQAGHMKEEKPVQMYMRAVKEMIASRKVNVIDVRENGGEVLKSDRDVVGFKDGQYYYFFAGTLWGAVVKFYADQQRVIAANEREILRMLKDEGICTPDSEGKITRLKRIGVGEGPKRVLWMPRWQIDGTKPPEQQTFEEVDKSDIPDEMK